MFAVSFACDQSSAISSTSGNSGLSVLSLTLAIVSGVVCLYWFFARPQNTASSSDTSPLTTHNDAQRHVSGEHPKTPLLLPSTATPSLSPLLHIYFGSQTGTAESFANELAKELETSALATTKVVDLEEFDPEDFVEQKWIIFVVATYGEGEPTDNAVAVNKWLVSKQRNEGCLASQKFAVFGLGNRQYSQYNEMGKRVERHMKRLGATQFCVRGEGDDDQDIEADFSEWRKKSFFPAFKTACDAELHGTSLAAPDDGLASETTSHASANLSSLHFPEPLSFATNIDSHRKPCVPLKLLRSRENDWNDTEKGDKQVTGCDIHAKMYFHSSQATLKSAREIRQQPSVGFSTFFLEIDISEDESLRYSTGDNLDILPQNSKATVSWFLSRLGITEKQDGLEQAATDFIHFEPRDDGESPSNKKRPFPTPCTIQQAFSLYCDLEALPHKSVLKEMAYFVSDEAERRAVQKLLAEESAHQFKTLVKEVHMSLREFISIFMTTAKFELSEFLQLIPRQRFRPYTISSSSRETPETIAVTVSRVREELPSLDATLQQLPALGFLVDPAKLTSSSLRNTPRVFNGVCSSFLCQIRSYPNATQTSHLNSASERLSLCVVSKPSQFKLPQHTTAPVIMIANGSGVAPFRGFLREFSLDPPETRRKTMLIFGCTHPDKDWLFREEMEFAASASPPILTHLICAFSRLQEKKIYVQDELRKNAQILWEFLKEGAYVYICGGMAMGHAVEAAIADAALSCGCDADYLECLKVEGRLLKELWS